MWTASNVGDVVGNLSPVGQCVTNIQTLKMLFGEPTVTENYYSDEEQEVEISFSVKFKNEGSGKVVFAQIWGVFNRYPKDTKTWTVLGSQISDAAKLVKQFLEGAQ